MHTIDDAKAMARRLRSELSRQGREIGHSEALELVAVQFGHRDWNTASTALRPAGGECSLEIAIPVFRSLDEGRARSFYCDILGFEVEFEHRFEAGLPLYLGLRMGPVALHLSEHPGDAIPGSSAFFWMQGVDAFRRRVAASSAGFAVPELHDQPWGREIGFIDPFGNRLRFCQRPAGGQET